MAAATKWGKRIMHKFSTDLHKIYVDGTQRERRGKSNNNNKSKANTHKICWNMRHLKYLARAFITQKRSPREIKEKRPLYNIFWGWYILDCIRYVYILNLFCSIINIKSVLYTYYIFFFSWELFCIIYDCFYYFCIWWQHLLAEIFPIWKRFQFFISFFFFFCFFCFYLHFSVLFC